METPRPDLIIVPDVYIDSRNDYTRMTNIVIVDITVTR